MNKDEFTKYQNKYKKRLIDKQNYYYNLMDMAGEVSKNSYDGVRYNSFLNKMEEVHRETEYLLSIADKPDEIINWGKKEEERENEAIKYYKAAQEKYELTSPMKRLMDRLSNMFRSRYSSEEIEHGKER